MYVYMYIYVILYMYRYIYTQQYSIITLFETQSYVLQLSPIFSIVSSEMALNIFVFLKKLKKSFGGCL